MGGKTKKERLWAKQYFSKLYTTFCSLPAQISTLALKTGIHLTSDFTFHMKCTRVLQSPWRLLHLLEIQLWMVISCDVGTRNGIWTLCERSQCSQSLSHLSSSSLPIKVLDSSFIIRSLFLNHRHSPLKTFYNYYCFLIFSYCT